MKFSANLGFLWTDLRLPEAIFAAKNAGFAAVECHWPFSIPADEVKAALDETQLPMLGLNTRRGDTAAGDNGLAAIPGRETEARAAIDEAIEYARLTGTKAVHVMAGYSGGPSAREVFCANLAYACANAGDIKILIEPLNHYDAPGYFLFSSDQALAIIREVAHPNLKFMFDCYHLQIMDGDLTRRLTKMLEFIGHIQIASVPDRGEPDRGELDYRHILRVIKSLGWNMPIGAEYKPRAEIESGLLWTADYFEL